MLALAVALLSLGLLLEYLAQTTFKTYVGGGCTAAISIASSKVDNFCTSPQPVSNVGIVFSGAMVIIFSGFVFLTAVLAPGSSPAIEKQENHQLD